jgi:hypothetical protein
MNISMAKLLGYGPIALAIMCLAMVFNYSVVFGSHSADMNKSGAQVIFGVLMAVQVPMILAYFFMDLNEEYKIKMRVLAMQGGAFFFAGVAAMSVITR